MSSADPIYGPTNPPPIGGPGEPVPDGGIATVFASGETLIANPLVGQGPGNLLPGSGTFSPGLEYTVLGKMGFTVEDCNTDYTMRPGQLDYTTAED